MSSRASDRIFQLTFNDNSWPVPGDSRCHRHLHSRPRPLTPWLKAHVHKHLNVACIERSKFKRGMDVDLQVRSYTHGISFPQAFAEKKKGYSLVIRIQ